MLAVALLVSSLGALAAARVFERCELARELLALGVQRERVATWVCIAYHESRFDTAARNHGSGDHGLLQISELYWCGPGKACGAPCSAFRDDDIADDVRCALQIHAEHTRLQGDGFLAWVVYPHHCKQNAKKFIVDCDKNIYKNIPMKIEDSARSFKPYDIRSEPKPRVVNNPYRSPVTPRYLSINSIFQGDFVNEFERNYYDNFKQSNWLNFKVDNIDALEIPGAVAEVPGPRLVDLTTRPTPVPTIDPNVIGIKPPSPRKIESNQFRCRKTFSQPQCLQKKNSITGDREKIQTTTAPSPATSEAGLSFNQDISQNMFLNLQPSVLSKSLKEFSSPEIKYTELKVKNPRREKNFPAFITVNDFAQNPFLNSVFKSNFNTRAESTTRFASLGYALTSRPEASLRSSKEIDFLRYPKVNSNIPQSSNSHVLESSEDTEISGAVLAQNPFLSRIFRVNNVEPSTGSKENYKEAITLTTEKPTTAISLLKYPSTESSTARQAYLEISTKRPQKLMRSRARYFTDFDKTTNETPVSESPTTPAYSTRRYHTINRQRTTTKQDEFKSTRAIEPVPEKSSVSSTEPTPPAISSATPTQVTLSSAAPTQVTLSLSAQTQGMLSSTAPTRQTVPSTATTKPTYPSVAPTKPKSDEIETTASETTTILSTTLHNVTVINQLELTSLHSTGRTEITSEIPTTRAPEITTRASYTRRLAVSNTETASVSHSTSRPATTRTLHTVSKTDAASKWQTLRKSTTISSSATYTTSRPQEFSKLPTTNKTQNVRRSDRKMETVNRLPTTRSARTTREPQKPNRWNTTTKSPTTPRSWSYRRFNKVSTMTTPRPSHSWRRQLNQLSSTATSFNVTEKPLNSSTEASTGKTTLSVFDLYLRPSTRAPFKPFEFTSSRLRKGISIFSGGTTKPPPSYYTHKKSNTEELRETDT